MTEIELVLQNLRAADCPEDVLGISPDATYRRLAKACHPDLHPGDPLAVEALRVLNAIKSEVGNRVKAGTYGNRSPINRPISIGAYTCRATSNVGDLADVFTTVDGKYRVKVARDEQDNDLMRAEVEALTLAGCIPQPVRAGVPELFDKLMVGRRQAHVSPNYHGWRTLAAVGAKVDARTSVWLMKRLLTLLGWVHHLGLVHGAVLPQHVLVYPDNDGNRMDPHKHTVRLIDWCYSVHYARRTRLSSWVPAWKAYYAPELLAKTGLTPSADLYMAAALVHYAAPDQPHVLRAVLERALKTKAEERYQTAEEMFTAWDHAARAEYGKPVWHDFNL